MKQKLAHKICASQRKIMKAGGFILPDADKTMFPNLIYWQKGDVRIVLLPESKMTVPYMVERAMHAAFVKTNAFLREKMAWPSLDGPPFKIKDE